jgi:rhamnogalacturonan acetylesterase
MKVQLRPFQFLADRAPGQAAVGLLRSCSLLMASALIAAGAPLLVAPRTVAGAAAESGNAPAHHAKPTLFIIGDSTVRNRTRGQLGWGDPIADLFDRTKINVTNRALGGRSSRSFLTEGLWGKVLAEIKPGDFVLIQFGHNDGGPLDDQKARASLKGTGDESRVVTNKVSGKVETVHTYGWYMRKYIADTKARGATPIVLSLVPRKIWKDGKIVRGTNDYAKWAADAAKAEGVDFIDLNDIVARHYEQLGPDKVNELFADEHTHTNPEGARLNAQSVAEGLRGLKDCKLTQYLLPDSVGRLPSRGVWSQ